MHRGAAANRREEQTARLIRFYTLALFITALDQFTKHVALTVLSGGHSIHVIPGVFHFTLVYNTGIAFGLFQNQQAILFLIISASILLLLYASMPLMHASRLGRTALALILGGALGNWIDRIRFQAVIDFLDFRIWPVFNLADSAITVGVALYLLQFAFEKKNSPKSSLPPEDGHGKTGPANYRSGE